MKWPGKWPTRWPRRRRSRPTQLSNWEGYAVPSGSYIARRWRDPGYVAILGLWVVGIVLGMMGLSVVTTQLSQSPNRYVCPPDCGRPPTGFPVTTNPRFTAANGQFSVSYPDPGAAYTVTKEPNGVTATWNGGDGGTLRLFGEPAAGRSAEQVAAALMAERFPDSEKDYELPNAMVGFEPGYGQVADFWPQSTNNTSTHLRVIVIVAVKNDVALIAAAAGPYHEFGPEFGPGPPSPANLQLAQDMGKYVNSFSWRGDPPR